MHILSHEAVSTREFPLQYGHDGELEEIDVDDDDSLLDRLESLRVHSYAIPVGRTTA
jgi:hypothetical protein